MGSLCAVAALLCLSVPGPARQEFDPEARLREINEWYQTELNSRTQKSGLGALPFGDVVRSLKSERKSRVQKMIEGVAPESVSPEDSLAMGQLYCYAEMPDEKAASARRFLTTLPGPARIYEAHMMILQTYTSPSDATSARDLLLNIRPVTERSALTLLNEASTRLRRIIADGIGPQAALHTLDHVRSLVPFDRITRDHAETGLAENALVNYAIARAELLLALERPQQARKTLAAARLRVRPGTFNAKTLNDAVVSLGFAK